MKRVLTSIVATVLVVMTGSSSEAHTAPAANTLNILLTNDDGYTAGTLLALKKTLIEAGHRVTVVAPCTDQSGKGTAQAANYVRGTPTPDNTIVARQISADTWAVCGTPADAVLFGLSNVLPETPPDVVISGINPGQNTGATALHSGTVGATVMASELVIPAIAVSVELDVTTSPPTLGSVTDTAVYIAQMLRWLQAAAHGGTLLPQGVVLNVNYPVGKPKGTRLTQLGLSAFVRPRFSPSGLCADCYLVLPDLHLTRDPVANSDHNAMLDDYISVTPLDGDWTAQLWPGPLPRLVA